MSEKEEKEEKEKEELRRTFSLSKRIPFIPPKWARELNSIPKERLSLGRLPTPFYFWDLPFSVVLKVALLIDPFVSSSSSSSSSSSDSSASSSSSSDPSSSLSSLSKFNLFIKRDDETGCVIGGNKIRKLEFILAEALRQQKKAIITIGGTQSNHCRITASAAKQVGLQPHLILRMERKTKNERETEREERERVREEADVLVGNCLVDRMCGSNIYLVSRERYLEVGEKRLVAILKERLEKKGIATFSTPSGGSDPLGCWGYITAIEELTKQMESLPQKNRITDIVVAMGSGGTAEGICLAVFLSGLDVRVHGVAVCDDTDYFYGHLEGYLERVGLGGGRVCGREILRISDSFVGLGYGKARPEELQCQRLISQSTGLLLDPSYTGKAAIGLCSLLYREPERFKGNNILFWHTGGVLGVFGRSLEEREQVWGKEVDDLVQVLSVD